MRRVEEKGWKEDRRVEAEGREDQGRRRDRSGRHKGGRVRKWPEKT